MSLRWSAPADCPTGDEVQAEVQRLVGSQTVRDAYPLQVVADVQRTERGAFRVRLEIPGSDGPRTREVTAESCVALGHAVALILAMMIDPEAALAAEPKEEQPARPNPAPAPPKTAEPATVTLPKPLQKFATLPVVKKTLERPVVKKLLTRRWPPVAASLNVLVDVGTLPSPAFGFGRGLSVYWRKARFELGAVVFPPRAGYLATKPSAGTLADMVLGYGAVSTAFAYSPAIEFAPAIRFELGRLHESSFGVSNPGEGAGFLAGAGVGGRVTFRLSRTAYAVSGVDTVVMFAKPTFIVDGIGVAHTPQMFVVRLATGFEWRF